MSKLHIVTVATDPLYYYNYLKESCARNNNNIVTLGFGRKWRGFAWKFNLMIKYLSKLPLTEYVCFVDGYDVVCCRNLDTLINDFIKIKKERKCKIVVGHDKIYKEGKDLENHKLSYVYVNSRCKNQSLNSGTYIGLVKDVLEILKKTYNLDPKDNVDDQVLLTEICKNTYDIYIYVNNLLFLTMIKTHQEIDNYLIINKNGIIYNDNKPYFIHGAGDTFLDNVIKKLGYKINNNIIQNQILNKQYKKDPYNIVYEDDEYKSTINNDHNYYHFILFLLLAILILYNRL